jgi:hypothetical protein
MYDVVDVVEVAEVAVDRAAAAMVITKRGGRRGFQISFYSDLVALPLAAIQARPMRRPLFAARLAQILLELGAPVRPSTLATMAASRDLGPLAHNT